jgi:hypothetical protein
VEPQSSGSTFAICDRSIRNPIAHPQWPFLERRERVLLHSLSMQSDVEAFALDIGGDA